MFPPILSSYGSPDFEIQKRFTNFEFQSTFKSGHMTKNMRAAIGAGLILLIPFLQFLLATWHWKPGVFVLGIAILLGGAVLIYEMITKNSLHNKVYRLAVAVAILSILLLVWMNVAVGGILGDDPANMMYFGVLLVGLAGAGLANVKPGGMSVTLFATGFAIMLVPAIALMIGTPAFANGVPAVFGLHAIFASLFVVSGLLFRKASRGVNYSGE
jgi:hypothetical protein